MTWLVGASTLPSEKAFTLADRIRGSRSLDIVTSSVALGDSDYSSRVLDITDAETQKVIIVLQHALSEAIFPSTRSSSLYWP